MSKNPNEENEKKDRTRENIKTAIATTALILILLFFFMLGLHFEAQSAFVPGTGEEIYNPEPPPEPIRIVEIQPIYFVYRYGSPVNACPEIQWMIWRLANEHGYCHRLIFGLILRESTFRPNSHNTYGNWQGLTQIHPSWTRNRLVAPYRLTEDHAQRTLFDPYEHMLTLMEIWNYARSTYDIDTSTEQGMREILWWHMSGNHVEGIDHHEIRRVFNFAGELVENPEPHPVITYVSAIFVDQSDTGWTRLLEGGH